MRREHLEELGADVADPSVPIHPGYVIQALNRNVAGDAVISVDVGDHTY